MYIWGSTQHTHGYARKADYGRQPARGDDPRSHTDEKYSALWHVQYAVQPSGCSRNRGQVGGIYTWPLPASHNCTLDARPADGDDWRGTRADEQLYIALSVGRRYHDYKPWATNGCRNLTT